MVKIEILWGEVKFLTGSTVCEESGATLSRIGEIPIPTVKSGRKKKKNGGITPFAVSRAKRPDNFIGAFNFYKK